MKNRVRPALRPPRRPRLACPAPLPHSSLMSCRKAPFPLVCIAACLLAQACVQYLPPEGASSPPPPPPPPYPAPPPEAQPAAPNHDTREVDALMAPIALYPDPLIAILLPASTQPSEIAAASAYLVQYGDMSRIDSQPWDPSVRALAHYPTVIAWMAQNLEWTKALGSEFASSPAEAMDSIQRLRARAWAAGTLSSTPQQQVFSDDGAIDILPTPDDALYVPAYDPSLMFPDEPYYGFDGPFMLFGGPFAAGIWLDYSFDWRHHRVWHGNGGEWHQHGGWRAPYFGGDQPPQGARPWHPRHGDLSEPKPGGAKNGNAAPAPRLMPGAPKLPPPLRARITEPRPAQPAPAVGAAQPVPGTSATPKERPRLGVPVEGAPQGPAGAAHTNSAPARARPAPPPAPGTSGARAPASAPARAQAAPASAHAAAAPAVSSSSSSSSSSSDHQPQK